VLGSFYWSINWELNNNADAKKGGYVVQHVQVKFDVKNAKDAKVAHPADDGNWDYWELWQVKPNYKKATGAAPVTFVTAIRKDLLARSENKAFSKEDRASYFDLAKSFWGTFQKTALEFGTLVNDTYAMTAAPDLTQGTITFTGTAWYLDGLNRGDVPMEFTPGGGGKTHAGTLLATTDKDAVDVLNNRASARLPDYMHTITVTWNATEAKNVADRFTKIGDHNP
jgi:hypothetical protein